MVAWNIQQYIDNGKASEIGSPKEVKVVDDKTVMIQYEEWANNWDNVIGDIYICSKEAYEKNGEEWCKTHAVGTGPVSYTHLDVYKRQKFLLLSLNEDIHRKTYGTDDFDYFSDFHFHIYAGVVYTG